MKKYSCCGRCDAKEKKIETDFPGCPACHRLIDLDVSICPHCGVGF